MQLKELCVASLKIIRLRMGLEYLRSFKPSLELILFPTLKKRSQRRKNQRSRRSQNNLKSPKSPKKRSKRLSKSPLKKKSQKWRQRLRRKHKSDGIEYKHNKNIKINPEPKMKVHSVYLSRV